MHSALALALASIALALGVLAVQPVAGHSFRCVSGFEPTTIGSCVNTHFHRATFTLKVEAGITGLGFRGRVYGLGFRMWDLGFRGSGFGIWGSEVEGLRVQGSGFRL